MRKAFTLIELLVVVSIIALLIAILLPALSAARDSAIRVQCLSQVRSLGQAVAAYRADNKGAIPQRAYHPNFLPHRVANTGYDMNKDFFSQYLPITITGSGASADRQGDEILFCPGDMYEARNPESTTFNYKYQWITYQYYTAPLGHPNWVFEKNGVIYQPDPAKPDDIELAKYPLWGDLCVKTNTGSGDTFLGHDAVGTPEAPTGINTSYGDGSAFWAPWNETDTYLIGTNQEYIWSELNS